MKTLVIAAAALAISFALPVSANGGSLGGNVAADSGAVNVSIGKCTMYKLQVKEAAKQGIDTSTIEKPKGC